MKKICMLIFYINLFLLLSIPTYAKENSISINALEDTEEAIDNINYGVYVYGNNKIVNELIQQEKFANNTGHAFAAERGNNLIDVVKGKNATVVGDDNAKNGADRMIINKNGTTVWIQDKYYKTASKSIAACFEDGNFRYYDSNNRPMQIEVPSDQYNQAVELMKKRIKNGQIKGVTDPEEAYAIVKEGKLTYKQAVNLAKAGTVESLIYDSVNGTISSTCAFGISTILNYAVCRINGCDRYEAIKTAGVEGIRTFSVVFASDVIASQLTKTGVIKAFEPQMEKAVLALGDDFVNFVVKSVGGNASGLTNVKFVTKLLTHQGVAAVVTVSVLSIGDIYDICTGRISGRQMIKDLATTTAGVGGGYFGTFVGGAAGSALAPGVGTTVGSVAGGIVFGGVAAWGTDFVLDMFYEDDADIMIGIIKEEFGTLCIDYFVNEEEAQNIMNSLSKDLTGKKLKEMYKSSDRNEFAKNLLIPLFDAEVSKRAKIDAPSEEELRTVMKEELEGVIFIH